MTNLDDRRPLATFLLVAYNQEDFIEEAVEGAFAQTYRPLEIVLSDDCSSDRTFEIMQGMAAKYEGPHEVKARRTPRNLGVLRHVQQCGSAAKGSIVVTAAGDDVSAPNRVERLVAAYDATEVLAAFSAFRLIDAGGNVIREHVDRHLVSRKNRNNFKSTRFPYEVIAGSTASYRAELFDIDIPTDDMDTSEDRWLNFLVYLRGGAAAFVNEALVSYRAHPGALANNLAWTRTYDEFVEVELLRSCRAELTELRAYRSLADMCAEGVQIDFESIDERERVIGEVQNWSARGPFRRIGSCVREAVRGDLALATWKAMRVIGRFPRYQPRMSLKRWTRTHP